MSRATQPLEDLDEYSRIPPLDASATLALGADLIGAAPKKPSADVARTLKRVRATIADLEASERDALEESASDASDEDVKRRRAADVRLDAAWSAAFDRLSAWTKLPEDKQPEPVRPLLGLLFADGLEFTQVAYRSQWGESQLRLGALREENREESLTEMIGDVFVAEIHHAHAEYAKALAIGADSSTGRARVNRSIALNAARAALRKYARQIVAMADDEDEASVAATQRALAPIARVREAFSERQSAETEPKKPDAPTP